MAQRIKAVQRIFFAMKQLNAILMFHGLPEPDTIHINSILLELEILIHNIKNPSQRINPSSSTPKDEDL